MHLIGPVTKRAHDKEIIKLEKFVVTGGKALHGEVTISGAKNAAVGILPATILAADVCVIENLPDISDVAVSVKILSKTENNGQNGAGALLFLCSRV